MTNQPNTCKFDLVNLDNYLLVQESDWWHLELHNTLNCLHLHLLVLKLLLLQLQWACPPLIDNLLATAL
jgi:hypothetical protein